MVTASLEEHLGENLRSLVLDTTIDGETEFGSVRSASVRFFLTFLSFLTFFTRFAHFCALFRLTFRTLFAQVLIFGGKIGPGAGKDGVPGKFGALSCSLFPHLPYFSDSFSERCG